MIALLKGLAIGAAVTALLDRDKIASNEWASAITETVLTGIGMMAGEIIIKSFFVDND